MKDRSEVAFCQESGRLSYVKISKGTRILDQADTNGYGYATRNMYESLERLGHEVTLNDQNADVEIWFDQPHFWKFSKNVYRIGYHPWESTKLLNPEWEDIMNACDEIWTPSPLIAEWYKKYMNLKPPVYVYEHGVDPAWKPVKREFQGTFKFLHVGGEAARKGSKEAMAAVRLGFPRNVDISLTMKMMSQGWKVGALHRINILNAQHSLEELIQLFHDHHVYVYPSYGEGFGLTPLQALATGMPTITVPAWAPYAEFLDPKLSVSSVLVKSPWPQLHPGHMLKPKQDDVIEAMRYAYQNYDEVECTAHQRTLEIAEHYSWDRLTKEAFEKLEKRLSNSQKTLAR